MVFLYIVKFEVGILKDKDIETPVVCNIFDVNGEVAAGVASVEALVSWLSYQVISKLKQAKRCILQPYIFI